MANTIGKKYVTDENGEKFYPIGHVGAIYDSSGNTLDSVLSGKAPTNHASTGTTYGASSSSYYGHVRLSDSVTSTSSTSDGYAATPYAVKQAYDRITANYVNSYGTSGSWKAVYTNGGGLINLGDLGSDYGVVVLEGMGRGKTSFTFHCNTSVNKTIIVRDAKVYIDSFENKEIATNFIFENCHIATYSCSGEIYLGSGNVTCVNCTMTIDNQDDPTIDSCRSGIVTEGDVKIIGGSITLTGTAAQEGFDTNFIYSCNELTMQGVTIKTSGDSAGRINLIRNCNKPTVNGCHIYLNGNMHSIGHIADTDRTVGGSFTGNYVEYYKTYMRFATISGNTFNHLGAGSAAANQIVLQCPTNMSGNTFKGSAAYVDAQSQKVIVDRNLHDNGLTVSSAASGSITTNNIQY